MAAAIERARVMPPSRLWRVLELLELLELLEPLGAHGAGCASPF